MHSRLGSFAHTLNVPIIPAEFGSHFQPLLGEGSMLQGVSNVHDGLPAFKIVRPAEIYEHENELP